MKPAILLLFWMISSVALADNSACAKFSGYNVGIAKWTGPLSVEPRCKQLTGQSAGLSVRGTCLVNADTYKLTASDAGREFTLCLDFSPISKERIFGARIIGMIVTF